MSALLEKLHTLTPAELRELQGRAAVLLGQAGTSEAAVEGEPSLADLELVHAKIVEALTAFGETRKPPFAMLRNARHYASFLQGVPIVTAYVAEALRPKNRAERAKAIGLVIRVIARRIARGGRVPVCHRTISEDLSRCSDILQTAFPGYMASGLLPVLLQRQEVLKPV